MASLGRFLSAAFLVAAVALAALTASRAQAPTPAPEQTTRPGEPFGEEVVLAPKKIVYLKGTATWDTAFDTLVESFKSVYDFLDRQGIKPAGPAMAIYTATDDTGFEFEAAVPIADDLKDPPQGDLAVGTTPDGKARKFVHHGSYDQLENTYDAITHFLDDNKLEARELYIEQYLTDPRTSAEAALAHEAPVPSQ